MENSTALEQQVTTLEQKNDISDRTLIMLLIQAVDANHLTILAKFDIISSHLEDLESETKQREERIRKLEEIESKYATIDIVTRLEALEKRIHDTGIKNRDIITLIAAVGGTFMFILTAIYYAVAVMRYLHILP